MPDERDLFYERMVRDQDWDDTANPFETRRRLEIIFDRVLADRDLSGLRLLDAGSGGGHFSAMSSSRGAEVVSLDMGLALLEQVAKRCKTRRTVGSVLALPFADASFDFVLSTEVVEHTPDPLAALDELSRVVRPGGALLVTTPVRLWQPVVRAASALGLRPYQGRENFVWPHAARRRLEAAGIDVQQFFGFNLLPLFDARLDWLLRLLDHAGSLLPFLYVNFAVFGTRNRE
jgi:2-polyprenyl-3-methyl-5-hydroxy-6-metoxy-1,4-benzoquinol methylase